MAEGVMRTTETRDAYLGMSPGGCRFPAFGIGANSVLSTSSWQRLIPRGNHGYPLANDSDVYFYLAWFVLHAVKYRVTSCTPKLAGCRMELVWAQQIN